MNYGGIMNVETSFSEPSPSTLKTYREVYKNLLSEMKSSVFHRLRVDLCNKENVSENADCSIHGATRQTNAYFVA